MGLQRAALICLGALPSPYIGGVNQPGLAIKRCKRCRDHKRQVKKDNHGKDGNEDKDAVLKRDHACTAHVADQQAEQAHKQTSEQAKRSKMQRRDTDSDAASVIGLLSENAHDDTDGADATSVRGGDACGLDLA